LTVPSGEDTVSAHRMTMPSPLHNASPNTNPMVVHPLCQTIEATCAHYAARMCLTAMQLLGHTRAVRMAVSQCASSQALSAGIRPTGRSQTAEPAAGGLQCSRCRCR
jgi:hypothetical protein